MRVLIYGAGVIGCLYAALLSEAGHDVAVFARGRRLESLSQSGLRYKTKRGARRASVRVLSRLEPDDRYDFVFLTVREDQLHAALEELKTNTSPTIVTMVNSLEAYDAWEKVCGAGRILPAFPGAGGGWDGDVLDAALTPAAIQPTTIGKTDGRERELAGLLKSARIPCQIVDDMHAWQICHLAMVVPIADAYYESKDPAHAGEDPALMRRVARQIKANFRAVAKMGIHLTPAKMNLFTTLPVPLIATGLGVTFRSSFGDTFMYRHSMKAPEEMRRLHDQLYGFLAS